MYGVEWLIGLALLGVLAGLGGGYLLAGRSGGQRNRELEAQLCGARKELEDYRQEVVKQFSETARKFQSLNDSYTDLHEQLARSSSVLCGDITGPLLEAPAGHQDLLPAEVRRDATADSYAKAQDTSQDREQAQATGAPVDPYEDDGSAADGLGQDIRVSEPAPQHATGSSDEADDTLESDSAKQADETRRAAAGS